MTTRPGPARSRSASRLLRTCAVVALPTACMLWSTTASAQGWMKDRRFQEGPGIRAGDLELHPGIGGEIGYDSNWFYRSQETGPNLVNGAPAAPVRDAAILRITPSFSVSTLGAQRLGLEEGQRVEPRVVQFRGTVAATYREFFGSADVRRQRNVSGNAALRFDFFAGRPVAFAIFGGYQRLIQPQVLANPDLSFNRSDLTGGGEVTVMPGGGTLDLRAGYQVRASLFEQSQGVPYSSITHQVSERNRWRFRPRTALFHDTSLQWVNYPNAARAVNYLNDFTPIRTKAGLTGLVSERFGTTLAAGYGGTFFRDPAAPSSLQYDSFIAQAEGVIYLSKSGGENEPGENTLLLSTLTFGYLHDFKRSLLANFYTINRGYVGVEYWFSGKAVADLTGYVESQSYPQPFINQPGGAPRPANGANGTPTGDFTNIRAGGAFFGEYRLTDSVGINTTINYDQTFSDTQLEAAGGAPPAPGAPATVYDLNWQRFQAFLGARWFL